MDSIRNLNMIPRSELRVLYIIGQLRRGGAEQQLYYILKNFRHKATILVLEHNPTDNYWVQPILDLGYKVVELKRYGSVDWSRLAQLVNQINSYKPHIVHIFTDSPSGIYGRLAAIMTRCPVVIVNERQHPLNSPSWYRRLKCWVLNRFITATVVNSLSSKNYLLKNHYCNKGNIFYIPNGIDLDQFTYDQRAAADTVTKQSLNHRPTVGMIGSLLPKKAPEVFVRVARRVIDLHPEVKFLHIGKGPMLEQLLELQGQLGLTKDQLMFYGESQDIPSLLRAIDIFVLTSRKEGMPNVLMEAMAMRLPCVVTDTGDCSELVNHHETGFVIPVDDENGLVEYIVKLLEDVNLQRRMGNCGYEKMLTYSMQQMAENYRHLYEILL